MTDDEIWALKRGGHDYRKIYAAYKAAREHTGQPTVILAHTIKGYGLGSGFAGRNATHQMKKLKADDLKTLRDSLRIPITDEQIDANPYLPPYFHPGTDDEGIQYLLERRRQLGGFVPERRTRPQAAARCPTTRSTTVWPRARATRTSPRRRRSCACSRTWCGTRASATAWCRSSPTRPARSVWTRSSRAPRSSTRNGQNYMAVDRELMLSYKESESGQIMHTGINEAGARRRSRPSARPTRRTASR